MNIIICTIVLSDRGTQAHDGTMDRHTDIEDEHNYLHYRLF